MSPIKLCFCMPPVYTSGMPYSPSNNPPFILQDTDQTLQKPPAPSGRGTQCSPGAPTGCLSMLHFPPNHKPHVQLSGLTCLCRF